MNAQNRFARIAVSIFTLAMLVAVVACGNSSPTQPNMPNLGSGPSSSGTSVITGVVTSGGSSSSGSMATMAISPANIQVSVEGAGIGTRTDAWGRFRLVNVPSGTLQLRFSASDVNAMLTVTGVGSAQHVDLKVQLQPSSASIAAETREELEKFESLVGSVDLVDVDNGTVTLADTTMVIVDEVTWWDTGGDYFNLTDLEAAVLAGIQVEAKGQGTLDPATGKILASVIRAKSVDAEFEGIVQSASGVAPDGTIVLVANLEGGVAEVRVDGATVWASAGDLTNFADLLTAFDKGLLINVEGKGALDNTTGTFILAREIKAELEEEDFEGIVGFASGTDPDGTILLVSNDKGSITKILVDANTVWQGDASSLTELRAALAGPFPVKVEGEGWLAADGSFILATRIKVEIEDNEDKVCDDQYATQIAAIDALIVQVENVAAANGLNGGQTNSLVSKLKNVAKSLGKCNATPAVNQLGAFINEVNAYVGSGKVTATEGALLVAAAQAIINTINAVA